MEAIFTSASPESEEVLQLVKKPKITGRKIRIEIIFVKVDNFTEFSHF
jgi:hypothetical protein